MKIYTEVVYYWDDAKGELVKESEKSFDYQGPMTLCDGGATIAAIIAAVQLGTTLWGQFKGQQAQEEADKEQKRQEAIREALAIKGYERAEGKAIGQIATLQNVVGSEIDDTETNLIFEAAVASRRKKSTFAAQNLPKGKSTKFFIDRSFGDDLRKLETAKTTLKKKRADVLYKIEAVEQDLSDQYFNMETAIAGFGQIGSSDRTSMYLNMVNGGLSSLDTYFKYKKYFTKPETPSTNIPPAPTTHTSTNVPQVGVS